MLRFGIVASSLQSDPWLHRYAVFTALATLGLVVMGGLVTSHGVGMAVPDWPTSYGYNMFALPVSTWLTGGVFHEHTHRLWASFVGVLVVALTRWIGGRSARLPLSLVGATEIAAGLVLMKIGGDWKGAGHFLLGIGGVVLLAGLAWVRNERASGALLKLAWTAFWLVQLQGLLGGLRVVLDAWRVGEVRLGTALGIFHGCLGQAFLVLLAVIALFTSRWWTERGASASHGSIRAEQELRAPFFGFILGTTVLIFLQLVLGATMRHQHAGLAIPDFPLAYGKLWPDTSAEAVTRYNAQRIEVTALNPITSFQIVLQMLHRGMALLIFAGVAASAWKVRSSRFSRLRRLAFLWLALIVSQIGLGAWTIWSNKAADVATAHVLVGALSLVTGVLISLICLRRKIPSVEETASAGSLLENVQAGVLRSTPEAIQK